MFAKRSLIFLVFLVLATTPLFAQTSSVSSTNIESASSSYYKLKEVQVSFTSIADSNITASTFAINNVKSVAVEIINDTTQTIGENRQGVAMPTGLRLDIYGAASPFMPSGTLKPLQRKNTSINTFGRYEFDATNLGVLRATLVSSTTPGHDVRAYFRYVESSGVAGDGGFSEEY